MGNDAMGNDAMGNDAAGGKPRGPRWEEAGDANVPAALAALYPPLPETLYCPHDVARGRYLFRTLASTEDCGLVCFLDPRRARAYVRAVFPGGEYGTIVGMSLDGAHDLALGRHAVVNCLLVVGADFRCPSVHYVR